MFDLSIGFGSSGFSGSANFSKGGVSFNLSFGGSSRRFATGIGNAQDPQDLKRSQGPKLRKFLICPSVNCGDVQNAKRS